MTNHPNRHLTPAKRRVLDLLSEGPLTFAAASLYGYRRATIDALCDMGLVKYRPYAQDPHYALTQAGRDALR